MGDLMSLLWQHLPGIAQGVTTCLFVWGWWSLKRVFITRAECAMCHRRTDARLDAVERRQGARGAVLQKIEAKLAELPTRDDLAELSISFKGLEGDIKETRAQMEGLTHLIARLERMSDLFSEVHMK